MIYKIQVAQSNINCPVARIRLGYEGENRPTYLVTGENDSQSESEIRIHYLVLYRHRTTQRKPDR